MTTTLELAANDKGDVTEDRAARLAHLISEMLKSDLVALENLSEVPSLHKAPVVLCCLAVTGDMHHILTQC